MSEPRGTAGINPWGHGAEYRHAFVSMYCAYGVDGCADRSCVCVCHGPQMLPPSTGAKFSQVDTK